MKIAPAIFLLLGAGLLGLGTWRNRDFWSTADQRGDALFRKGEYTEAARAYADPARIGVAQFRDGAFEAAAKTFGRVPGAVGAYNQGNAWLMHGKYDAAIAAYDRALGFRTGWSEALENKALAQARKAKMEAAGENREQEQTDTSKPDQITFDQKGDDRQGRPTELAQQTLSDEELRATWLRQVQTTPADFLRVKFAQQASHNQEAPK